MLLKDLGNLIDICSRYYQSICMVEPDNLPIAYYDNFCSKYTELFDGEELSVIGSSFRITSKFGSSDISRFWLNYAVAFSPLYRALECYEHDLSKILKMSGISNLGSVQQKQILKKFPSQDDWRAVVDNIREGCSETIDATVNEFYGNNEQQKKLFLRMLDDPDWWCQGKKFDRGTKDWIGSSIKGAAKVIQVNSDRLPYFVKVIAKDQELRTQLRLWFKAQLTQKLVGGKNVIFYGAPGTGKSYKLEKEVLRSAKPQNIIRCIFHSETQNSDFIGGLRPSMRDGELAYTFQPGPFSKVLCNALNKPNEMHYLIIEEINRASAAAVFGEVFQLLDRDGDGNSEYSINPTDPMQKEWIQESVLAWDGKVRIPSNLSLLATMNSSDQAVLPMDTAFKRRWRFEYIPIDFTRSPKGLLTVPVNSQWQTVSWKKLALSINALLTEEQIPEDKHLGPWFLSDSELLSESDQYPREPSDALKGKLFIYLWDDVLRHGQRDAIFSKSIRTYGQLISAYQSGKSMFSDALLEELELLPKDDSEQ